MANTYATFTPGTSTNNNKFTMSVWVKRTKITGDYQAIYDSHISGGGGAGLGLFIGNDNSVWYNSGTSSSAFQNTSTSRKLRDLSGWYHIVVAGDTTQSGTDKLKIWINNEQQTSFGNDGRSSFAGLSYDLGNSTYANQLGRKHDNTYYFDGVLSHFHFIDGTAYTPSTFGSTDATTGEWKINTGPSVTYGNNGFFLFQNDNSLNDDSGEGNNFALGGGTLTKTEDCPDNVFATFNTLFTKQAPSTTNMGNTRLDQSSNAWKSRLTTIGASSGKYYAEFKAGTINSSNKYNQFGVVHEDIVSSGTFQYVGDSTSGWGLNWGGSVNHNGSNVSGYTSFTTGDIIGVAMDLDNHKVYWRKNDGAWLNSGDPTSGSTGTGAQSLTTGKIYFFAASVYGNECFANFGNGYFGTTAISSEGTNASGIGKFEYDVPTGYTALSTKGLNE